MVQATRKRAEHLGPARRRPEILDGALQLFLEHGYEGTSMQAVANRSGVTKPVIYAAFESKDTLFRALLEREEQRIMSDIGAGFENVDLNDPEKTLIEGYTAFLRAVTASPEVYRLIFFQEGGGNAAVGRRIQAGREAQVRALAALSRNWLSHNDSASQSDADLDRLAEFLGQALVGLAEAGARSVLAESHPWDPEEAGSMLGRLAARSATGL
ncbi:MAG: TetR/AcrR family transcriptional regulator [Solirubrobacterales bacterium]